MEQAKIKTSAVKKKRQVLVTEDSLLKHLESPICKPDLLLRDVC